MCARVLNVSKEADSDSGSDESDSESESENGSNPDEPEVEDDFDSLGNKIARKVAALREKIPEVQPIPYEESAIAEHARCYPSLVKGEPRWQVSHLKPWQLVFADLIKFDYRVRGNKAGMLVVYDLVTDGVRVAPVHRKALIGDVWDRIVTQESLHLRPYKVTVVTDGCGAMHGILAEHAYKRGIDHLPIPPHQPHLNNVEGIVASYKADVAACLTAACAAEGPISEAHVMLRAEYVAYI